MYEHLTLRWTKILAICTGLLALATFIVAGLSYKALNLSERAWIVPTGAVFVPEKPPPAPFFETNRPIHFIVNFINSGREPGFSVNYKITNSTIESYDPARTTMETIVLPENNTCNNLMPESGRPSFSPSSVLGITMDSMHGDPALTVDDKIMKGDRFYVVQGCVAYAARDDIHRSGFCYILEYVPATNKPPAFGVCAHGFYIDQ